ncbi:FAD binding domain of DNA photolyase [compost metagenome]
MPQLAALPDKLIHAPWKAGPLELAAAGVSLVDAGEALGASSYPRPLVDHAEARDRTLARFSVVKGAVDSQ